MKFKSFTLFLFLVIFSISTFAQSDILAGKWGLQSIKVDGNDFTIPVGQRRPEIRRVDFQPNGKLGIRITCNSASGKYSVRKNNRFKYTSGITTMMFCGTEEHEFANIFNKTFTKVTKYTIKNKVLTFQDNSGANILTFIPAPKGN